MFPLDDVANEACFSHPVILTSEVTMEWALYDLVALGVLIIIIS